MLDSGCLARRRVTCINAGAPRAGDFEADSRAQTLTCVRQFALSYLDFICSTLADERFALTTSRLSQSLPPIPRSRRCSISNRSAQGEASRRLDPELQRELVARIAHTGTLQAAVWQMGKHATGAEALYKVADARTFRLSWDAAIIIGRRRNGLNSRPPYAGPVPGIQRRNFSTIRDGGAFRNTVTTEDGDCPHCGGAADPSGAASSGSARTSSAKSATCSWRGRAYLLSIAGDPERQAAWELLCGPADWDAASAMKEQPDEQPGSADVTPLRQATLQIPLKTGFMPHFTDPGWDANADPLPQLERSVIRHDPRGPEWAREPPSSAPGFPGEGDHGQHGGGAEGEGD